MATTNTNVDQLRDIIRRDMELILAFLAQDQSTAIDHLVRFSHSQGIPVTASELSAALAAKQGRLHGVGTPGGIMLGHSAGTAHTSPF